VIRIGERYIGNWPTEVQQAIAVLTTFVEQTLAAEADGAGAGADADRPSSGSALRESAEKAAREHSDAATAHPEAVADGDEVLSACGAVEAGPADVVATGPEFVLVRGLDAYETVSQALG